MDKLDLIFDLQKELAKEIRKKESHTPTNSDMCIALMHEVMELHDEFDWKWWKHDQYLDVDKAIEELADIVHFVVQLAINLGMTPQMLFSKYHEKNQKNRKRQIDGY